MSFFNDVGAHIRCQFTKYREVAVDMAKLDAFQRKVGSVMSMMLEDGWNG